MCDEVVPGDLFEIGNEVVIRFQPLVSYDARSELLRALFLLFPIVCLTITGKISSLVE